LKSFSTNSPTLLKFPKTKAFSLALAFIFLNATPSIAQYNPDRLID